MQPRARAGRFRLLVRKRSDYAPGDVVLYDNPTVGANVLHRIVSRDSDGFRLKGDANGFVDDVRPTSDQIVGRAVAGDPRLRLRRHLAAAAAQRASRASSRRSSSRSPAAERRRAGAAVVAARPRGGSGPEPSVRPELRAAHPAPRGAGGARAFRLPRRRRLGATRLTPDRRARVRTPTGSFSYASAVPKSPVYRTAGSRPASAFVSSRSQASGRILLPPRDAARSLAGLRDDPDRRDDLGRRRVDAVRARRTRAGVRGRPTPSPAGCSISTTSSVSSPR